MALLPPFPGFSRSGYLDTPITAKTLAVLCQYWCTLACIDCGGCQSLFGIKPHESRIYLRRDMVMYGLTLTIAGLGLSGYLDTLIKAMPVAVLCQ